MVKWCPNLACRSARLALGITPDPCAAAAIDRMNAEYEAKMARRRAEQEDEEP